MGEHGFGGIIRWCAGRTAKAWCWPLLAVRGPPAGITRIFI